MYRDSNFNVYGIGKLQVTLTNTGNDDYPEGVSRGVPSPLTPGFTIYVSSEGVLEDELILVEGLGWTGAQGHGAWIEHEALLDGTNPVQIGPANGWVAVNRAWLLDVTGDPEAEDQIWVSDSNVHLPPGRPEFLTNRLLRIYPKILGFPTSLRGSESPQGMFTVPSDYEAWIMGWYVQGTPASNQKRREMNFWIDTRKWMGTDVSGTTYPWRTRRQLGLGSGAGSSVSLHSERFATPIHLEPWEDVRLRFWGAGGNIEPTAGLDLVFRRLEA